MTPCRPSSGGRRSRTGDAAAACLRRAGVAFVLVVLASGCATRAQDTAASPPAGWHRVSTASVEGGHGGDEVIGRLSEAGLRLEAVHWAKPSYGDQNLLWLVDEEEVVARYAQALRENAPRSAPPWRLQQREGAGPSGAWSFLRAGPPGSSFAIEVWSTRVDERTLAVVYWGSQGERFRGDLRELLQRLHEG